MPLDGTTNFTVSVRPLYDAQGKEIPGDIVRGVYRDDTDEVISQCGKNFKPVQHQDVLHPMLETLQQQGYELHARNASRSDLEDLKGQRGAFINTKLQNNGAIMRTDIIVGDFVQPTGRTSYLADGPDTMLRRFTAFNSHDGTYAVKATNGYFRLLCLNGMMNPEFTASSYGKHTQGFSIAALQRQILTAAELMEGDAEKFGLYARTPCSLTKADLFLKGTLALLPDKPSGAPNWSEALCTKILERFKQEDQTVWGLVNAMTWWATHAEMRGNAGEITARTGRDDRVAAAMRSSDFKALV